MEPRRLVAWRGRPAGPGELRLGDRQALPGQDPAPWFAAQLKDRGSETFPEATTFRTGIEHLAVVRPLAPEGAAPQRLYARKNGGLGRAAPRR